MCEEHRNLTCTLMLLFLPGVLCNMWRVRYQQQLICAVKGSSVVLLCSFYYPDNQRVTRVMWGRLKSHPVKFRLISASNSRNITPRFHYIGDIHQNCSLKIHQVEYHDEGKYLVRFNNKTSRIPSQIDPELKVVDLTISISKTSGNGSIRVGDSVNLTCINSCDGAKLSAGFIWFKDGAFLLEGPVLYLRNLAHTNSGNYTCSLKAHTGTTSRFLHIDVEYGPRNTSVLVRQTGGAESGSYLTLICSSHANPPVENYTWFKIAADDIRNVGPQSKFIPGDGGKYLCSATNKHGSQNSSAVTLNTEQYWPKFRSYIAVIAVSATVAVLLIFATLIMVRRRDNNRMRAPVEDNVEDMQNTDYVNWLPMCETNQSQESAVCEGVTTDVVYTTVCFQNKTKRNIRQQMDSQSEDVIYSTVCRGPVAETFIC